MDVYLYEWQPPEADQIGNASLPGTLRKQTPDRGSQGEKYIRDCGPVLLHLRAGR